MARFKLRAQQMRNRRAHTEKLFNSFQRLDGFTGTVLPSVSPSGNLPPNLNNNNNNSSSSSWDQERRVSVRMARAHT